MIGYKFIIVTGMIIFLLMVTPVSVCAEKIVDISSGYTHVIALTDIGTVFSWGDNNNGQLGIGSVGDYYNSAQIVPIQDVRAISAGSDYNLALKNDGTVWAWGSNYKGRLGDGTTEVRSSPVKIEGLSDIIAISAGLRTIMALKADGTVWAWGDYTYGHYLSPDDYGGVTKATPEQIGSISDIKSLGERGVFAVANDGSVWAWGTNVIDPPGVSSTDGKYYYGRLGSKSETELIETPFRVDDMDNVKQISLAHVHGMFLKNDGTVWAWGNNYFGELGSGTASNDPYTDTVVIPPVKASISDVKQISCQGDHNLALKNDGSVWWWGYPIDGKSIVGKNAVPTPTKINGLNDVKDISTGLFYCVVLKKDGSVWGWGNNEKGQLGDHKEIVSDPVEIIKGSAATTPIPTPTPTPTPTPATTPGATTEPTQQDPTGTPTTQAPTSSLVPLPTQASGFDFAAIFALVGIVSAAIMTNSIIKRK